MMILYSTEAGGLRPLARPTEDLSTIQSKVWVG